MEFVELVVTYHHPRFQLLASKIEVEDDAAIDQAERSWDAVEDVLEAESDT